EPGRDVHAIPKEIAVLDHDVADIEPHAELDAIVLWRRGIAFGHAGLDLARAPQPIDDAAKLNKQPVARRLHQPTVVGRDRGIDQVVPDCSKPLEGAALISADQSGVAGYIRSKDRGKTAGLAHGSSPVARRRPDRSSSRCSGLRRALASATTAGVRE